MNLDETYRDAARTWFGAMLTLDNMDDIAKYQHMIKQQTGVEIDANEAVQDLIQIGADSYIREY